QIVVDDVAGTIAKRMTHIAVLGLLQPNRVRHVGIGCRAGPGTISGCEIVRRCREARILDEGVSVRSADAEIYLHNRAKRRELVELRVSVHAQEERRTDDAEEEEVRKWNELLSHPDLHHLLVVTPWSAVDRLLVPGDHLRKVVLRIVARETLWSLGIVTRVAFHLARLATLVDMGELFGT